MKDAHANQWNKLFKPFKHRHHPKTTDSYQFPNPDHIFPHAGTPDFTALGFIEMHRFSSLFVLLYFVFLQINPPSTTRIWLALLWYLLYYGAEPKLTISLRYTCTSYFHFFPSLLLWLHWFFMSGLRHLLSALLQRPVHTYPLTVVPPNITLSCL